MSIEVRLRRYAVIAALIVCVLAAIDLITRGTGRALRFSGPQVGPMLTLLLAGASLALQSTPRGGRLAQAAAALALALGFLGLAEALAGINSHLDGWAGQAVAPSVPGSIVGIAAGIALLVRPADARQGRMIAGGLAVLMIGTAGSSLLASAFTLTGPEPSAMHAFGPAAAFLFILLALALLCSRLDQQALRVLEADTAAGILARRLLFIVLVQPALLTVLLMGLLHIKWVTPEEGLALFAVAGILSGLALVLLSARAVFKVEARREESDEALNRLNLRLQEQASHLQETVAARTVELSEANAGLRAAAAVNARLALVASHTTNGVIITDAQGRVEWVNAAHERITGAPLAELQGRDTATLLAGPESKPADLARLREALQQGERCTVELRGRAKDGAPLWQLVNLEPVRDREGRVVNFIAIETDLTEQHLARQHLQALNQRLALATQSASLGVWEWDPATRRLMGDERALAIHGIDPATFDGTPEVWTAWLHAEDRAAGLSLLADSPNGADQTKTDYRIVVPGSSRVRQIEACAVRQRDGHGRLERITGTVEDVTARHEATQQLTLLNERLQLALRSTNYGVWEYDLVTNQLIWDERMFSIYGVAREAFDGDREIWIARLHPEDRDEARETMRKVIAQTLPSYDTTFRIVGPDGVPRHIEAHGYLHRSPDGRPIRLVGLNRDITAERQLQAALDLAEQRWQLALEGSNDAVWDWNLETGALYHDDQWARMLGYRSEDVAPGLDGWRSLVHPDDLPACEEAIREHLAQATAYYLHEYRMRSVDGGWKWILDRGKVVSRAADGRALRMVGTHSDITSRKQLEQRLRQVEELAAQVSRLAQIGGWELDLETSRLTWSAEARRIHGLSEEAQPTLPEILSSYPPEARATLETALEKTMLAGTPFDLELPLDTPAGRRIWVRVIGDPEFRNSQIVGVQGAIQDTTARHESEEARRQLETQLFQAQKMETLGTLAGGIAHDFNNLLTGIIGYNELAADSVSEDNPAHACLIEARNAGMRARELVEQILTFGRQSSGEQQSAVDLSVVIDEARRFLRATLPASVTIGTEVAANCPLVLADATQIHQVILNLGSNAAHAMRHSGGRLHISLQPLEIGPEQSATLGGLSTGGYVRLSVSDTGHGMDEATLRRVFDPFFTTKNTREGTGLGLAVVHGIVRAHHGAIDVESTTGVGSAFHIYLPAAPVGDGQALEPDRIALPRGRGEVIFVVDDEEIVGRCTQLTLEARGYQSTSFGSAEECLRRLQDNPAACQAVITDQTMPGMQGTELAGALRRLAPTLPIVIMSGYFSKISPNAIDELGTVELLAKPFTPEELMLTLDRALKSKVRSGSIHPFPPATPA